MKQALKIVLYELKLEYRNKSALGGLFIYAFSTVFVTYLSVSTSPPSDLLSAFIWIAVLFVSINAAGKSFLQEQKERMLYYYSLVKPTSFILGKIFYTSLLVGVMAMLVNGIFILLFDSNIEAPIWYAVALLLGGAGFAATITFISAIAMSASGNFTLVSVLSFPVLLPFLVTQVKFSKLCIAGFDSVLALKYVGILVLLNLLVWALAYLLFPYLWRD